MSSQGGSRHERRRLETRARILEAASELFGERGVDATKVAAICERADVARQTFFNHFARKRDLLDAFFRIGVDFLRAAADAAGRGGATTRESLRLFFRAITGAAVDVGPMNRDLMAQILRAGHESLQAEYSRRIGDAFLALVRRGLERGDVTARHEPEVLAALVQGALSGLMTDWAVRPEIDVTRRAGELADLVADALERRPDER